MQPKTLKKIGFWLIAAALVFLFVRWIVGQFPKEEDRSVQYPIQGEEHIAVGAVHPSYNSNPPTSGWHYAEEAGTGFYNRELPDEQLVHNLEHGHIWIAYRPSLSEEVRDRLRKFAGGMVIVTPREKNDADIALVAWRRLDKFDLGSAALGEEESQRIRDFILRYQNHGPEKIGLSR